MVKVIKINVIRCDCPSCGSTLEALKSDFRFKMTGRNEGNDFITCPVCGKDIESCYWHDSEK